MNGLRLTCDRRAFFEALRLRRVVSASPWTFVVRTEKCLLLRKGENSQTFVFFDFGEIIDASDAVSLRGGANAHRAICYMAIRGLYAVRTSSKGVNRLELRKK